MDLALLTEATKPMPKRVLGRTGFKIGIYSMGGQGILERPQADRDTCIGLVRKAYQLGVNYFDTAPVYGPSELIYGEALKHVRNKVFIATKTHERKRDASLKLLESSLRRLQTDYIDLWQIHHLESLHELRSAMAKDGVIQAMIELQQQGVVKKIGITGHTDPRVLNEAMARHPFDTVLCPVNANDRHMSPSFIDTTLRSARRRNMGIIGMKVFAQGFIFHSRHITTTWEALSYALAQAVSTVICGVDSVGQLQENVLLAKNFKGLAQTQRDYIEAKSKGNERRACFFRKEYRGYHSQNRLKPSLI